MFFCNLHFLKPGNQPRCCHTFLSSQKGLILFLAIKILEKLVLHRSPLKPLLYKKAEDVAILSFLDSKVR